MYREKNEFSGELKKEMKRQLVHISLGIFFMFTTYFYGRNALLAVSLLIILAGSLLISWRLQHKKLAFTEWFERHFERRDNPYFPGLGPAWYVLGVLLLASSLKSVPYLIGSIFILAFGDAFSTIVGMFGKHRFPYNSKKTMEGSVAFFVFSLPAYNWLGPAVFPLAFFGALAESLPIRLDDNIIVPLVCVIFFGVVG